MAKLTILLLLFVLMEGVARGQSNPCNSVNNHCVVLTWLPSPTWGIAGYNIYRGTKEGKEDHTPINGPPVAAGCGIRTLIRRHFFRREWRYAPPCTWTDNHVIPGVTYYYYIKTVDAGGSPQSAASHEASATVPTGPQ